MIHDEMLGKSSLKYFLDKEIQTKLKQEHLTGMKLQLVP